MEVRYPWVISIVLLIIIICLILFRTKKQKYNTGSKIANTSYLRNTPYFKKKVRKYHFLVFLIELCLYISLALSTLLLSRPINTDKYEFYLYNRDIILCMDVSASVDDLNADLVDTLKQTVNNLKGERFGISIFNASSVTLVPLTDDYEYVNSSLEMIKKAITSEYHSGDDIFDYYKNKKYIISGTDEGAYTRGSSLIGDGLTSCIYNFPKLDEEERTRLIIFSTDNDLAGTPLVDLDKACEISKKKNIKVYGIGTKNMKEEDKEAMKNAVLKTGGKFYQQDNLNIHDIVNDIEKNTKTLLVGEKEIRETDIPELPFIILLISTSLLIILRKKVIK